MFRRGLLWLSERQQVFAFVRRNRLARAFARRFVAGETLDDAIAAATRLAGGGLTTTLDLLGESVTSPEAAAAATDQVVRMVQRMGATPGIEMNVSVKLTQLGLDLDEDQCHVNLARILDEARAFGGFVRLDMESSEYTQQTLDFYCQRIRPHYGDQAGVVIQSALRRSARDIGDLVAAGVPVRLCKGAYLEPPEVAWPDKADVDRAYVELMERLLREGNYPAIATHDERIIGQALKFVAREGIPPERFEFQMLYGVRRDLQRRLRADGFRVRVYLPFGTQWYPYLMRRLAERPANIVFILGNLLREGTSRSTPK